MKSPEEPNLDDLEKIFLFSLCEILIKKLAKEINVTLCNVKSPSSMTKERFACNFYQIYTLAACYLGHFIIVYIYFIMLKMQIKDLKVF